MPALLTPVPHLPVQRHILHILHQRHASAEEQPLPGGQRL